MLKKKLSFFAVWVISVKGTINPGSADYVIKSIQAANEKKAEALIVELDTPGGLVSSVREMGQAISTSKTPVIVYVTPAGASATSAGALLSLASHAAVMAPGTNIGAAHPVGSGGEEIKGAMGEKVTNDVAAMARGFAEIRGRNPEIAELIVTKSKSYTAEEALKVGLIDVIAKSRTEMYQKLSEKKKINLTQVEEHHAEMSFAQKLLHLIAHPNVAMLLMSLGGILIYAEISTAGFGFAGIAGAISLILAFISLQVLPIQTGALALLVLGLILLFAELFVTTKGALAIGGIVSLMLGFLWLVDPAQSDLRVSYGLLIGMGLALSSAIFGLSWLVIRMKKNFAEARTKMGGGGVLGLEGYVGTVESVDSSGLAGKVQVRGEVWDFSSQTPLKVGMEVVVESAKDFCLNVKPR